MKEILKKLESLKGVCDEIYNIITRNDWTNGEISELFALRFDLQNEFYSAIQNGSTNKFNDLAKGTTIFQRADLLPKTHSAFNVYHAWILSLKSCEFGTQSDLMREYFIECLRELFGDSLSELRLTINQIKILQGEAQNENK